MIKVKIFTVCCLTNALDNLSIEECYTIFHSLTDLNELNSCFDRIVSTEREAMWDNNLWPGDYDAVVRQDGYARIERNKGNWNLESHHEDNKWLSRRDKPLKSFNGNIFWLVAVLFVGDKYMGHVYFWKYPRINLTVRIQGIRTSVDNYINHHFKGVGKTLIDAIIRFSANRGYRFITVWDPVHAMPMVLRRYGFKTYNEDYEEFMNFNKELTCDCMERKGQTIHVHTEGEHKYKDYSDEEYCAPEIHCEFDTSDYIFDTFTMEKSDNITITSYTMENHLLIV